MNLQLRIITLGLILTALVGCGTAGDEAATDDDPTGTTTASEDSTEPTEDVASPAESDAPVDEDQDDEADEEVLEGVATITFEDGEVLSTDVLCALEPQVAAGQEILYTATALDSPYFDLTVFGEDAALPGPTVSWDETEDFETYETSWGASGAFGSDLDVSLDGNVITGQGTFVRGEDATGNEGETKQGEVEVVCG